MKQNKKSSVNPMEYDYIKASSAQDCTGLIPFAITDHAELENYEELYPFLPKAVLKKEGE